MTAYIKRKAGLPSDGDEATETLRSCIQQNTKGGPNHSRLRGKRECPKPTYPGVNDILIFEVTCGYKYRVDIKREGNSFDKMSSRTLSDEEREKLIDLLNENEIWKWDGFRKFKPNKRRDHSFYFTLITYDDKTISANGYNAYPSNYIEVYSGLYDLFEGVDEKEEQCK